MPVLASRFLISGAAPVVAAPVTTPAVSTQPDAKGNVNIRVNGTTVAYISRLSGAIVLKAGNPSTIGFPRDAKGRMNVIKENTRRSY